MSVNSKKMQGVSVRTQSGQHVGKLLSFDLDADTGKMVGLRVKVSGFVPALLDQEALVAWSQVISMSEEEVVVRDGVVMEKAAWLVKSFAAPQAPEAS